VDNAIDLPWRNFEQLYSSPSYREKKTKITRHNEHQNTIDMLELSSSHSCSLQNELLITYGALTIQKQQILQRGPGKLDNNLLQDSYFTRNFLHLSRIITLGNLKSNIDWHSVTVSISLVVNNLLKNRLIGKSNNL